MRGLSDKIETGTPMNRKSIAEALNLDPDDMID